MLSDVTARSQNTTNVTAPAAPQSKPVGAIKSAIVKGGVRQRDDEDTILHHVGSDTHLGGSPQGVNSSIAKRSRAETSTENQTPTKVVFGSHLDSLSPFLTDMTDPSPSVSTQCRSSTHTQMRPSAAMDMEFDAILHFDDATPTRTTPITMVGPLSIAYAPNVSTLLSMVAQKSCPATNAPNFAVIGVDTANLGSVMEEVTSLLSSNSPSSDAISRALTLLSVNTNGLIAPTMFKVQDGRLTSLHGVPIVLCSVAEDPTLVGCISTMGSLSSYLLKYFTAAPHVGGSSSSAVPMFDIAPIEGLVLEKGDSIPVLGSGEPFGALFSWSVLDGSLERITQKPKLASYGIVQSMTLAAPVHTVSQLCTQVLSASTPFSVVYFGASWCPPCLRILKELPYMVTGLSTSTHHAPHDLPTGEEHVDEATTFPSSGVVGPLLKADYDTSFEVLEAFGVERIPTFVVLDGSRMRRDSTSGDHIAAIKASAVGMLQNSKRDEVATFVRDATGTTIPTPSPPMVAEEEENANVFALDADF